jgi:hypothetical protein
MQYQTQNPAPESNPARTPKQRHGCLTAWLVVVIAGSIIAALVYLLASNYLTSSSTLPGWAIPTLVIVLAFNIMCAVALFRWKKWGFWGFCASSLFSIVVNLKLGLGVLESLQGLISIIILIGVLQIGGKNKGWTQLE